LDSLGLKKQRLLHEELVDQATKGPAVEVLPIKKVQAVNGLRGHVRRSALDSALEIIKGAVNLRKSEVAELHAQVCLQKNIAGFQVQMGDSLLSEVSQGKGDFSKHFLGLLARERSSLEEFI
jgi:hypothetical protein